MTKQPERRREILSWIFGSDFIEMPWEGDTVCRECNALAFALNGNLATIDRQETYPRHEAAIIVLRTLARVFHEKGQRPAVIQQAGVEINAWDLRDGQVLTCSVPESALMPALLAKWSWPALCRVLGADAATLAAALREADPECSLHAPEGTGGADA